MLLTKITFKTDLAIKYLYKAFLKLDKHVKSLILFGRSFHNLWPESAKLPW